MNFRDFMKQRAGLRAQYPGVLDLTETNVVEALGHFRAEPAASELPEKAHRCHLAEYWLDAFNLPRSLKPQALVSSGVRHSLEQLFSRLAGSGVRALLPGDIYPVYLDIARKHALEFSTYAAEQSLVGPLASTPCDVLLVTNPAKPWGRWLADEEVNAIRTWLAADWKRRVIVDAVYTWDEEFDRQSLALFETGQAYLLHSLSKGWLRPLSMGVALVPAQDVDVCTPVFRNLVLPQEGLRIAQALLTAYLDFPLAVSLLLLESEMQLRGVLEHKGLAVSEDNLKRSKVCPSRYHFIVDKDWEALLVEDGILALPLSVFGGEDCPRSVVTTLQYASQLTRF